MTVLDTITTVEEQALDGVKQAQDAVLGVAKSVADTIGPRIPEVPVSYPAELPQLSAVVDNLFDFATKLLATNRVFTKQLFDAVAPMTVIRPEPVAKVAPKAPKAAA